jgi:hypothetical protein
VPANAAERVAEERDHYKGTMVAGDDVIGSSWVHRGEWDAGTVLFLFVFLAEGASVQTVYCLCRMQLAPPAGASRSRQPVRRK